MSFYSNDRGFRLTCGEERPGIHTRRGRIHDTIVVFLYSGFQDLAVTNDMENVPKARRACQERQLPKCGGASKGHAGREKSQRNVTCLILEENFPIRAIERIPFILLFVGPSVFHLFGGNSYRCYIILK